MNYLAHFLLASQSPRTKRAGYYCGALLGDFIKGPLHSSNNIAMFQDGRLPDDTRDGIALHRHIDARFDRLEIIRAVRSSQPENLRRFGGILIDLCCDNLLAIRWAEYSKIELSEFENQVLTHLSRPAILFPERARRLVRAFEEHSIMSQYNNEKVLELTLSRIAKRLSVPELAHETRALWLTKESLEPGFSQLMQHMQEISMQFIASRG